MHTSKLFRSFMQFGFPLVLVLAVMSQIYFSVFAWHQIKLPFESMEGTLLLSITVYSPVIILILSFLAWRVMLRHYRRIDEMKAYIEAAGGQVFVDSFLADQAVRLPVADAQEMEEIRRRIGKFADWAKRLGYRVRANPFEYLHSFERT